MLRACVELSPTRAPRPPAPALARRSGLPPSATRSSRQTAVDSARPRAPGRRRLLRAEAELAFVPGGVACALSARVERALFAAELARSRRRGRLPRASRPRAGRGHQRPRLQLPRPRRRRMGALFDRDDLTGRAAPGGFRRGARRRSARAPEALRCQAGRSLRGGGGAPRRGWRRRARRRRRTAARAAAAVRDGPRAHRGERGDAGELAARRARRAAGSSRCSCAASRHGQGAGPRRRTRARIGARRRW